MTPDGIATCRKPNCRPVSQHGEGLWYIECRCGMQTGLFDTEPAAKAVWNGAMGGPTVKHEGQDVPIVGVVR